MKIMNKQRTVLIVANGTMPKRSVLNKVISGINYIICADGGANHARRMKLQPDVIIGDLDSITYNTIKYFSKVPVMFDGDRNSTDLEKSIRYCIRNKFKSVVIIGATGDRIDHTIGNVGCFKKFSRKINIKMIDSSGELSLIKKKIKIDNATGKTISLIPIDKCKGVSTKNLKYKLKNDVLELGSKEGTSNEVISDLVTVTVKSGYLLLYITH
jgi:thiamine pyrophosphokinase